MKYHPPLARGLIWWSRRLRAGFFIGGRIAVGYSSSWVSGWISQNTKIPETGDFSCQSVQGPEAHASGPCVVAKNHAVCAGGQCPLPHRGGKLPLPHRVIRKLDIKRSRPATSQRRETRSANARRGSRPPQRNWLPGTARPTYLRKRRRRGA